MVPVPPRSMSACAIGSARPSAGAGRGSRRDCWARWGHRRGCRGVPRYEGLMALAGPVASSRCGSSPLALHRTAAMGPADLKMGLFYSRFHERHLGAVQFLIPAFPMDSEWADSAPPCSPRESGQPARHEWLQASDDSRTILMGLAGLWTGNYLLLDDRGIRLLRCQLGSAWRTRARGARRPTHRGIGFLHSPPAGHDSRKTPRFRRCFPGCTKPHVWSPSSRTSRACWSRSSSCRSHRSFLASRNGLVPRPGPRGPFRDSAHHRPVGRSANDVLSSARPKSRRHTSSSPIPA